jgi:NADPH-dependent ferric siderophore reductase
VPRISRDADVYPITMRELEVLRVDDITPGMRRVIFGGSGLLPHTRDGEQIPGIVSDGFDDDMRIIFPHPTTGERPYPVSLGDGRLDWNAEVNDLFRTYTVRTWDPSVGEFGELTVDFARHGSGLAENWSSTAEPGDKLYAAGPKNCASLPVHTDRLLLIGDETALPAIGRCLEEVPAGHPVTAIIEVADRADIQDDLSQVACADTLDLRWVVRSEGGDFTEDVDALSPGEGTPFVWAAGESGRLKKVRAWVKRSEIPREHVQITGYWCKSAQPAEEPAAGAGAGGGAGAGVGAQDATNAGAGAEAAAPATPSSLSPLMALHEMAEIAPGFALATAARIGVFEAVDTVEVEAGGPAPLDVVADSVSVDAEILVRFLRYLETMDLVDLTSTEGTGDSENAATAVQLTSLGRELADPDGVVSRLTGPSTRRTLAWLHMDEGLRSGQPVYVGSTGKTWSELRDSDSAMVEELTDGEATRAQWVAPALASGFRELPDVAGDVTTVAVAGAGEGVAASVYADELLRHDESLQVTVLNTEVNGTTQVTADRLIREIGEGRRDRCTVQTWSVADVSAENDSDEPAAGVVILVDPFAVVASSQVPNLLATAGRTGKAVVVVTQLLAESGDDDHDYEEDLTRMLLNGGSVPTKRDLSRAIAEAGLQGVGSRPVGWGSHAVIAVAT